MARSSGRPRHRAAVDLQRLVAHERLGAAELMLGLLTVLPLPARIALGALLGPTLARIEQQVAALPLGALATRFEALLLLGLLGPILVGQEPDPGHVLAAGQPNHPDAEQPEPVGCGHRGHRSMVAPCPNPTTPAQR